MHLEAQRLTAADESVGVRLALDQEVTWRGARFEVTLQLRVLADGSEDFRILRLDQGTAPADADHPARLRFRVEEGVGAEGKAMTDPVIARRLFTDGTVRPVYLDD